MHESHLEPTEATPHSKCALICQKMRKNLLLTLTVMGEYYVFLFTICLTNLIYCKMCKNRALTLMTKQVKDQDLQKSVYQGYIFSIFFFLP